MSLWSRNGPKNAYYIHSQPSQPEGCAKGSISSMTKTIFKVLLVFAALGLCMVPAHADQLYVCQPSPTQNCTSAPGGTAIGGESNLVTNTGSFDIGNAGNHTQDSPLLIIVAELNGVGGQPTISFGGTSSEPLATVGTYGLTANTLAGFDGGKNGTGTAYAALGLNAGGSESFVNFAGADLANGFGTATSFTLYAFSIPTVLSGPGMPITIDESGAAPGSFILAYSCMSGDSTTTACSGGDVGETIFTNAGLVDTVTAPEPGNLGLLALGLLGLVALAVLRPVANLS